MYLPQEKNQVTCHPADGMRGRFLARFLAVTAVLAVLVMHAPAGNSAEVRSLWLDDSKPVASVLFTQEDLLDRLSQDLGLSASQLEAIRNAGMTETRTLALLKRQSDAVISRDDLNLDQKQVGISSMGYNEQVREAVQVSRIAIETTLSSGQLSNLPGWIDARMQEQRGMAVQAALMASTGSPVEASAGPYRVYATQYFSNFGAASVDVAVPDKYAKFAALGWEYHSGYPAGGNYSVNLVYNGRSMNVPVKDCGPWNIDDNYWNTTGGTRPRRLFNNLPTGMPESQAAYYDNYNGGLDQFGRTVSNPAGVDLSPQAGVQLGLGYLVSGWVNISFNWEGAAAPPAPAYPIVGAIRAKYDSLGGAPGSPHNAEYDVPGGRAQDFDNGRIIWNRATGSAFWVYGGILAKFDSLGGTGGFLGMPTSDEYAVAGGRAHNFSGGQIYWSAATGVHFVVGGIMTRYNQLGGPAVLGLPTSDEYDVAGGRVSRFTIADLYWSATTGVQMIWGGIRSKYDSMGGAAVLGLPTSDEYDVTGGRASNLQVGRIFWSAATGTHHVMGGILNGYDSIGGPAALGLPLSDEQGVGGSRMSEFSRGRIYWNASNGAISVYGGIFYKYSDIGGHNAIGLPTANESDVIVKPGARVGLFERGQIYWSAATGAHPVYGGVLLKYMAMGGPASMGLPTWDEVDIAGGRAEPFEIGRIYWSAETGAHPVYGAIMAKYDQMGGPVALGMPTTDETNVTGHPGARMSIFKTGRIYWSADTGADAVYGGILGTYLLAGGPESSLGLPITDEFAVPGGRRSNFQHGFIIWDYSTGTTQITVG